MSKVYAFCRYCVRFLCSRWRCLLALAVLAVGLTEAIWGTLQLFGVVESGHTRYPVTGSFYNPGPFGCMLGCIFPLALGMCIRPQYMWIRWVAVTYLLMCALLLPGGMSRTGWIAAVAGSLVTLGGIYRKRLLSIDRKSLTIGIFISVIAVGVVGSAVYFLKKDSADGRFLMWKVAALATTHSPLKGVGWDCVAGAYGDAQEEYFREKMNMEHEVMIAGTPIYVFNEYLQLAIAFGIPVGVMLLIALLLSCGLYIRDGQYGMAGVIVGIGVTCMASYPLQFDVFIWLIGLCVMCSFLSLRNALLRLVAIVVCYAAILMFVRNNSNVNVNDVFPKAYAAYKIGNYREAIDGFKEVVSKTTDPMPLNIIGLSYQSLEMPDSAEYYFKRAVHRVPNRFYPHYLLMLLYAEHPHDSVKMRYEANYLLTTEPKNPSQAVDEMREKALEIIKDDKESDVSQEK